MNFIKERPTVRPTGHERQVRGIEKSDNKLADSLIHLFWGFFWPHIFFK